jgi:flagellar biosynthesis/type III secretory pathway protein FliH
MDHTDEQLIQAYSQEVFGSLYDPEKPISVEQLIENSRQCRRRNAAIAENRREGYANGYEMGYRVGLKRAEEGTIPLDTLREMTIHELCELCERNQ